MIEALIIVFSVFFAFNPSFKLCDVIYCTSPLTRRRQNTKSLFKLMEHLPEIEVDSAVVSSVVIVGVVSIGGTPTIKLRW